MHAFCALTCQMCIFMIQECLLTYAIMPTLSSFGFSWEGVHQFSRQYYKVARAARTQFRSLWSEWLASMACVLAGWSPPLGLRNLFKGMRRKGSPSLMTWRQIGADAQMSMGCNAPHRLLGGSSQLVSG